MYRDVVQWSKIRHRILVQGDSRGQVARETGISTNTIDKMLAHGHPQPYGPRSHRYPRLGPHVASIRRMLQKNAVSRPRPGSQSRTFTNGFVMRKASSVDTAR